MAAAFTPGDNIAIKVPAHEYEQTVHFYHAVLGFEQIQDTSTHNSESTRFRFGDKTLWIDCIDGLSQAEVWLEVCTDDLEQAAQYLDSHHCQRRDEIEPLPADFRGFWISSPANLIHLVHERKV